jgi:hypothetical protein
VDRMSALLFFSALLFATGHGVYGLWTEDAFHVAAGALFLLLACRAEADL